jgi:hypothetical protein
MHNYSQTSKAPDLTCAAASENSGRKPAPDKQPAMINPKTWKCACGSENTGQFCPKCGSKKPAPVVEQKSAPAQPSFLQAVW